MQQDIRREYCFLPLMKIFCSIQPTPLIFLLYKRTILSYRNWVNFLSATDQRLATIRGSAQVYDHNIALQYRTDWK